MYFQSVITEIGYCLVGYCMQLVIIMYIIFSIIIMMLCNYSSLLLNNFLQFRSLGVYFLIYYCDAMKLQ